MKNLLSKGAIIAGLILFFGACKKNILDTQPETSISDQVAFSTPAKILAQVNNQYSIIENAGYYGGRQILFNEQRGEEFSQNDPNSAVGASVWGQNALSTDNLVNNVWTEAYASINAANILISKLASTTVIPDSLQTQYAAEAKFVRAFNYLALVQTFAQPYTKDNGASPGLPLRLEAETSAGNNNLARSSVADVYKQIIQDLNDAEAGLAGDLGSPALNSSRAHTASAIALKTRAYLVQGNYAQVIAEAKKIVPDTPPYLYSSGTLAHKLEPNIATVFGGSYTGPESIFTLPVNNVTAPDVQSSLAASYLGAVVLALNPQGIVANPALSATASTDARKKLILVKNSQNVLGKFARTTVPYTDFIPLIRYAEVLLNYAEAAARTGDTVRGAALLAAVRNRSDPSYTFSPADIGTQAALINTILTERRIELLGEGFRTPDLQRLLQTLPSKTGAAGTAPAVAPTDLNYIWPLPSGELSTNNLIQ
jgi:hypothetical protein